MDRPRIAAVAMLALATLAGCAATPVAGPPTAPPATAATTPTIAPTLVPSPTAEPVFAAGSRLFGVDLAGLSLDAAAARLRDAAAELPATVELRASDAELSLDLAELGIAANLDTLLDGAAAALAAGQPFAPALDGAIDEKALRSGLETLAAEVARPAEIQLIGSDVISYTSVVSRSFAYTPGLALDIDAAYSEVVERLAGGDFAEPIELTLAEDQKPPRVPLDQLQAEVEKMAGEWDGVVGFYFYDTVSGESTALHEGTVFAGASTIKVAIMLNAYVNLDSFDELEEQWLEEMIVESDNLAANGLLAAAAGGQGTEYAFQGADEMSTMLQEQLGLEHTYLYVPYETVDYIKLYKPKYRCGPQGAVGDKPYTEMGACLRATPYAIAQIYKWIDQCAVGEGVLIEKFERLNPDRCQEMLDRLETNDDKTRMVAGIPAGVRVEHKSGWIENMQADAGIVRSPGGDYLTAIYIYKPLSGGRYLWEDEEMAPVVAAFSRLAYTAYNPVRLDEAQAQGD